MLLLLACANICAELMDDLQYQYYRFDTANTEQYVFDAARAASMIKGKDGKTYLGLARWYLSWRYNYEIDQHTKRCYLTSYRVYFKANITLPMLQNGSQEQHREFQKHMPALRNHEYNHIVVAKKYAAELDKKLSYLPSQANCKQLEQVINALGHEQDRLAQQANDQYDEDTQHGKTEGIMLKYLHY